MRPWKLGNKGDTIVEVLIAMAVASAVLGGAYVIVSRTQQNSRQAQEHTEALGFAQGQVEQLKATAQLASPNADKDSLYSTVSTTHCFDQAGVLHTLSPAPSLPSDNDADVSKYPDGCKDLGNGGFFRIAFQYFPGAVSTDDYFVVYVDWPGATGTGDDHVSLSYQPYKAP